MNTITRTMFAAGVAGALLLAAGGAHAQSIEDKLRSRLRSTVQELRQLQDNKAQLQKRQGGGRAARRCAGATEGDAGQLAAARGDSGAGGREACARAGARRPRAGREVAGEIQVVL